MKGNGRQLILALLLLLILAFAGYHLLGRKKEMSAKNWEGEWKISYFYDNEPELLYTGSLFISIQDSLKGSLEVFAPMSKRSEQLDLIDLSFEAEGKVLKGSALHTGYKINEGNLRESFTLKLEEADQFSGVGECVAFCAEGTEGVSISWEGNKSNLTSNKNQ